MSEVMIAGKVVQVTPYYECNHCGFRTPASGGDTHLRVACPCKGGFLIRYNSPVPVTFPKTALEGDGGKEAKVLGGIKAPGEPLTALVVPDDATPTPAESAPALRDPGPAPDAPKEGSIFQALEAPVDPATAAE